MGWSLRPKRRAVQKINGLVEKINISCTSYTLLISKSQVLKVGSTIVQIEALLWSFHLEYIKVPYYGHKKLLHVLKHEAEKLSNSLNQGICSEILAKSNNENSTLDISNMKTNSTDFAVLLRVIDIDFF